jgi:hypothetical protein
LRRLLAARDGEGTRIRSNAKLKELQTKNGRSVFDAELGEGWKLNHVNRTKNGRYVFDAELGDHEGWKLNHVNRM